MNNRAKRGTPVQAPIRCIILGAAGRDFHDFLTFFRDRPQFRVCAFTAAQIPFIASRSFPRSLAGPNYPDDILIFPEEQLPELIRRFDVDVVFLAYSDLSHAEVMHRASLVQSLGAAFALLGPKQTQLESSLPVISVTAVRTGAGKSPLAQWLALHLRSKGLVPAILRHPMPYGDLARQAVERFASIDDLSRYACTIEEREEYTPYLEQGIPVFAGVDYRSILRAAEQEAGVVIWDGGNNDYSFLRSDLSIVVADALRPGHERDFYPGETNFRLADVIVINKVSQAHAEDVATIRENARRLNPRAEIIESDLQVAADRPDEIAGRRVLVVEDGPTLTHGGMAQGAGLLAARRHAAAEVIDPRPFAAGSIADVFAEFTHIGPVLPACGYSDRQIADLRETIVRAGPEAVVDASPAGLGHVIKLEMPIVRVRYRFQQVAGRRMEEIVGRFLARRSS
ncbi:MAG: tetraacyldisaccharide 4'-kinase [Planctomycetia bacterium]|nr:tetraacyldisaccharide 4'-kinase [Planctomycetia bacterium]